MWFVNIVLGFLLGCFATTFGIFAMLLKFDNNDKEDFIEFYRKQWDDLHKGE